MSVDNKSDANRIPGVNSVVHHLLPGVFQRTIYWRRLRGTAPIL